MRWRGDIVTAVSGICPYFCTRTVSLCLRSKRFTVTSKVLFLCHLLACVWPIMLLGSLQLLPCPQRLKYSGFQMYAISFWFLKPIRPVLPKFCCQGCPPQLIENKIGILQLKKVLPTLVVMILLTACTTVNSSTVQDMPSGQLCAFLDPNTWIASNAERQAIYAELKARNQDCVLPSGAAVDLQ